MYHEREQCFSDEKLMRSLRLDNNVPITSVRRGFNVETDILDRSCWNPNPALLEAGHYIESHLPRPLHEHRDKIEPLIDFLSRQYGGGTRPLAPNTSLGFQPDRYEFNNIGISKELLEYIFGRWSGGAVVELGGGDVSTRYLAERYDITTVEDSPHWLERHNARYVPAELVNGFYSQESIRNAFRGRAVKLLLIDGPANMRSRGRMVDFSEEFSAAETIIVAHAAENGDLGNAARELARRLGRSTFEIAGALVIQ